MIDETVSVARYMLDKCNTGEYTAAADLKASVAAAAQAADLFAKVHDLMPRNEAAPNQSLTFVNYKPEDLRAMLDASRAILEERQLAP
jgi:hypothetical protein